ncbi:MAG: tetratricopeptide repeat protein [Desulfobacca sp.]|nr:tetratricopeptide repeat protein [Desulfobacca sp.]
MGKIPNLWKWFTTSRNLKALSAVGTILVIVIVGLWVDYNYAQSQSDAAALQRSLKIREKALGPEHHDVAASLNNLAALYREQGHYAEAKPLWQRALQIFEKALGPYHPYVATCLENYATLLRKMGGEGEAGPLESRAKAIRAKHAQENL